MVFSWVFGNIGLFFEMGNIVVGGILGKMVCLVLDRFSLSYVLWESLGLGRDVREYVYCVNGIFWYWAIW